MDIPRYRSVSRDEIYERLNNPFNPPPTEMPFEDFQKEWMDVRRVVLDFLSKFGTHDSYAGKDFFIGEDISESRGIGVSLTNKKMATKSIVRGLVELLKDIEVEYEVCLSFDFTGGVPPIIFINNNEIHGDAPFLLRKRLGF